MQTLGKDDTLKLESIGLKLSMAEFMKMSLKLNSDNRRYIAILNDFSRDVPAKRLYNNMFICRKEYHLLTIFPSLYLILWVVI
jgi:hypothetical protein